MYSKIAAYKVVGYLDILKSTEIVLYADIWCFLSFFFFGIFFFLFSISFVCHAWNMKHLQIFDMLFKNNNILGNKKVRVRAKIG